MVVQYFVPHEFSEDFFGYANDWIIVIGILALPIGIYSLINNTIRKAKRAKGSEGFYALVTLGGFLVMIISGLKWGWATNPNLIHRQMFDYVLVPAQATLFSMLAFYIASAAYRAFRVRTWLAGILLVTAFIIMLRMIPLPEPLASWNNALVRWILVVPNLAAKRAIIIGVGLGAIAYSMKILLGIERSYRGRD